MDYVTSIITLSDGSKITLNHPENMPIEQLQAEALKAYNENMGVVFNQNDIVVRRNAEGKLNLTLPHYSTSDQEEIQRFLDSDDKNKTAADFYRRSYYQDVLDRYPLASRVSQFLNVPYVGEYLDEAMGLMGNDKIRDNVRILRDAMASEKPVETFGLNVAGGLLSAAPIVTALPESAGAGLLGTGTKVLPKILKAGTIGGLTGGLEGIISGYGRGKDVQDRKNQALTGGAWGTGLGILAGPFAGIMHGGKKLIDNVFRRGAKEIAKILEISEPAAEIISITLKNGGDIEAAVANIKRAGDEGMIVDANKAAEALLDSVSTYSPEGAQIVTSALEKRMANSRKSGGELLDKTLGDPPLGPQTAVKDIANRTRQARENAYNTAYSQPINWTSEKGEGVSSVLDRIPDRIKREAIEKANELMQMSGIKQQDHIKATILDNGDVVFSKNPLEMPNVMQLDYIKRALGDLAYGNLDNFNRLTPDGRIYQSLAIDLRDAVSDAVPDYRKAVRLGGDKINEEYSFKLGSILLNKNTTVEDVVLQMRGASNAEKQAIRQGFRLQLENILNDVKNIASNQFDSNDAREIAQAVKELSSTNARTKIRAILGDEAQTFLRKIDEIGQSSRLVASQAINSKTAPRLAIKEANDAIIERDSFFKGVSISDAVKGLVSAPKDNPARFREIYREIATVLVGSKNKDAIKALRLINEATKKGEISEANRQFVVRQLSLAGYASIPPATDAMNDKFTGNR